MLSIKTVSTASGAVLAAAYVVCIAYGVLIPHTPPAQHSLEMVFPGFQWLTFGGFVIGLLESFVYGALAGLVFVPVYNAMDSTTHRPA